MKPPKQMTDAELFREYYQWRDQIRSPAETSALREEIRRRVAMEAKHGVSALLPAR